MTMINIILLFMAFCIIGASVRLLERMVESALMRKRQDDLLDAAYSKIVRLTGRAVADWRRIVGGDSHDL